VTVLRPSTMRPIDAAIRHQCEARAMIAIIEREAIAAVSTNISDALRLAWLASELRGELAWETIQ
jgi:hypothetical protein